MSSFFCFNTLVSWSVSSTTSSETSSRAGSKTSKDRLHRSLTHSFPSSIFSEYDIPGNYKLKLFFCCSVMVLCEAIIVH